MKDEKKVIVLHPRDNVATALTAIEVGTTIHVAVRGAINKLEVKNPIPFGHKVALVPVRKGEVIRKYGEPIGKAKQDIEEGNHVHTHNVKSMRQR